MEPIGKAAIEFFGKRKIGLDTITKYGIHTANRGTPDIEGTSICYPFYKNGVEVNAKFRNTVEKGFFSRKDSYKTFWNADVMDDYALKEGLYSLIITEGIEDALSAIECGFPHTVSVPDGAPSVRAGEDPKDLQPLDFENDRRGKFEFMWNNVDRLKKIKRFIIATDNDLPGQRLAAELVRRLGESKCAFVEFPADCKDLNDVLVKHGPAGVDHVITHAKPYPVHGLYELKDYPEVDMPLFHTGWPQMDEFVKLWIGELFVITGIPNHGKSTWALNLLVNLAREHGWGSVIFSPEMPIVPHVRGILRSIIGGPDPDVFIQNFFCFIDSSPTGDERDEMTFDWLLLKAEDAVMSKGVRVLLIDPWNEVEQTRGRGEMITDYIGRSLRKLKKFARQHGVVVIVIAHPTKEIAREGSSRVPSPYDIEGSAHWYNKSDHCVVIDVPDFTKPQTVVHIKKARFQMTGRQGKAYMDYHRDNFRYTDGSAASEEVGNESRA